MSIFLAGDDHRRRLSSTNLPSSHFVLSSLGLQGGVSLHGPGHPSPTLMLNQVSCRQKFHRFSLLEKHRLRRHESCLRYFEDYFLYIHLHRLCIYLLSRSETTQRPPRTFRSRPMRSFQFSFGLMVYGRNLTSKVTRRSWQPSGWVEMVASCPPRLPNHRRQIRGRPLEFLADTVSAISDIPGTRGSLSRILISRDSTENDDGSELTRWDLGVIPVLRCLSCLVWIGEHLSV